MPWKQSEDERKALCDNSWSFDPPTLEWLMNGQDDTFVYPAPMPDGRVAWCTHHPDGWVIRAIGGAGEIWTEAVTTLEFFTTRLPKDFVTTPRRRVEQRRRTLTGLAVGDFIGGVRYNKRAVFVRVEEVDESGRPLMVRWHPDSLPVSADEEYVPWIKLEARDGKEWPKGAPLLWAQGKAEAGSFPFLAIRAKHVWESSAKKPAGASAPRAAPLTPRNPPEAASAPPAAAAPDPREGFRAAGEGDYPLDYARPPKPEKVADAWWQNVSEATSRRQLRELWAEWDARQED